MTSKFITGIFGAVTIQDKPVAVIDWQSYPHIFDSILGHCDYSTLLLLRGTSSAAQSRVHSILLRHAVMDHIGNVGSALGPHRPSTPYHKAPEWRLPQSMCSASKWYLNPALTGLVKTVDLYHTPNHPQAPVDLLDARVVRHFPGTYKCTSCPTSRLSFKRSTTDIWHVDWNEECRWRRDFIDLPPSSLACATAIIHCSLRGADVWTEVPLNWRFCVNVLDVVLLCSKPTPSTTSRNKVGSETGLWVFQQLVKVMKPVMLKRPNLRLTVVNLASWSACDPGRGGANEVDTEIQEYFLARLQKPPLVGPALLPYHLWPDHVLRHIVESTRFISLREWKREVGEEVYNLAMEEFRRS